MEGLIIKHLGKVYNIPSSIVASLILRREEFLLEGGGFIFSQQKIKEGIEIEIEIGEFEESTGQITEENDFSEIDPEYNKMISDPDWEWNWKLQLFREMESVLKEEGLID